MHSLQVIHAKNGNNIATGAQIIAADFVTTYVSGEAIAIGDAISLCVTTDGGLTAGQVYKSSAATLNQRMNFKGFALEAAGGSGVTIKVSQHRIYAGLTGLTPNSDYYMSDTNGALSTSAGTNRRWVGRAISSTILDRELGVRRVVGRPISFTGSPMPFDSLYVLVSSNTWSGTVTVGGVQITETNVRGAMAMCQAGDAMTYPSTSGATYSQITPVQ